MYENRLELLFHIQELCNLSEDDAQSLAVHYCEYLQRHPAAPTPALYAYLYNTACRMDKQADDTAPAYSPDMRIDWEDDLLREVAASATLQKAWCYLGPVEQLVLRLRYWEGRSFRSIGQYCGCYPSRIERMHRRALTKLRYRLRGTHLNF